MKIIQFPNWADADVLLRRPSSDLARFRAQMLPVLDAVKKEGDVAVRRFASQFGEHQVGELAVSIAEIEAAGAQLTPALRVAIEQAYSNIHTFHTQQRKEEVTIETMPGVRCWRKSTPIERVGLYIPGGSAPLFSTVLMLGVPAQIAGCSTIVLCTPPQANGSVHPGVLFAASLCGIQQVFKVGGGQAIAAMAYGTETIPQVWKIFGPGNPWVTAAKQLVTLEGVAIDMPAGPSEVAVLADRTAKPAYVAADLLSQAEHGADSQVLLVSDDLGLLQAVQEEVVGQLSRLPRRDVAEAAIANSHFILVADLAEGMRWINAYAPEHLILSVENPDYWADLVVNAGSVFLGHCTPESAGDYASGTNHTLPTAGYARAYSGVSLGSFLKKITYQHITPAGLELIGPTIIEMAVAEGLEGHAEAVRLRLKK